MGWMGFISSLIGTLAWPALILLFLRMYRSPIRDFLERLTSAKIGQWLTLSASAQLKDSAVDAGEQAILAKKGEVARSATMKVLDQAPALASDSEIWTFIVSKLLSQNPRAAVLQAHGEVLHALITTQARDSKRISQEQAIADLRAQRWIPEVFVESVEEILNLGNAAIRDPNVVMSKEEAENYVLAARSINDALIELAVP